MGELRGGASPLGRGRPKAAPYAGGGRFKDFLRCSRFLFNDKLAIKQCHFLSSQLCDLLNNSACMGFFSVECTGRK